MNWKASCLHTDTAHTVQIPALRVSGDQTETTHAKADTFTLRDVLDRGNGYAAEARQLQKKQGNALLRMATGIKSSELA